MSISRFEAELIADKFKQQTEMLMKVGDAIAERLKDHETRITGLEAQVKRLQEGPRMSVAQKIRMRGLS